MLSEQEKKEMLQDGLSQKRRKTLSRSRNLSLGSPSSLDDFIHFAASVQKVFSISTVSSKKTITKSSRL